MRHGSYYTTLPVLFLFLPQFTERIRILDVVFEDGSDLSFWDVYHIVKSYWKNTELFSWQEGDIVILDNYRMGHGRLPFTGERKVYIAFS